MQVVVVVKVAIPIDVENIDDTVVVVVDVVPVADAVAIPVVELREGGATCLTAWIRVCWVGVGLRGAVPRCDVSGGVQGEGVVLVLDVVVVEVVREVGSAHGKVAEVVWGGCSAKVRVKPIIDTVVVLVKRSAQVVVEVAVVIDFTCLLYTSDAADE